MQSTEPGYSNSTTTLTRQLCEMHADPTGSTGLLSLHLLLFPRLKHTTIVSMTLMLSQAVMLLGCS